MDDRFQFEKRHITEQLRGPSLASDPDYNKLKRRKNYIVDKVFQSMANLLFFFESIGNVPSSTWIRITPDKRKRKIDEIGREAHKELQKLFEDDVKDLLGIRSKNPKDKKQSYAFSFDQVNTFSYLYRRWGWTGE